MSKSDLVASIVEKLNISGKKAEAVVDTIFENMAETIVNGGRVEIRGFGTFALKEYDGYTGRNPKSGEIVTVKPKKLPFFKAGKESKRD